MARDATARWPRRLTSTKQSRLTDYEDSEGTYRHATKDVLVHLRNGSVRGLDSVLTTVYRMWVGELRSRGLLKHVEEAKPQESPVIPSRASANGGRMDMDVVQGIRFNPVFRMQKFNAHTGQFEAIDITGHEYQFTIEEFPPVHLDITITNRTSGEVISETVQLTEEEAVEHRESKTDEERERFGAALARKYGAALLQKRVTGGGSNP
jgi:hypothetical protein